MLKSPLSCPESQVGEDLRLTARSRAEVLAQVAREVAAPCPELDAVAIEAALQAREEEASTELGGGFAMPHAVLAGLSEPRMLNVAFEEPVQWGVEGGVVSRCVVILVPPGRERSHLKLVAQAIGARRKTLCD